MIRIDHDFETAFSGKLFLRNGFSKGWRFPRIMYFPQIAQIGAQISQILMR